MYTYAVVTNSVCDVMVWIVCYCCVAWEYKYYYRDYCAHLLIPLNKCRHENYYLPWKCEHERHDYETCEYKEYMRRSHNAKVKQMMEEEREHS